MYACLTNTNTHPQIPTHTHTRTHIQRIHERRRERRCGDEERYPVLLLVPFLPLLFVHEIWRFE